MSSAMRKSESKNNITSKILVDAVWQVDLIWLHVSWFEIIFIFTIKPNFDYTEIKEFIKCL